VVFTFVALIVPSAALAAEIASVVEKKTDSTQPAGDNKGRQLSSNAVSGASRSNATKFCMPSTDGRCAKFTNEFSGAYKSTAIRPVTAVFAACDVPGCRLTGVVVARLKTGAFQVTATSTGDV
jgi:hypothetical protein